MTKHIKEIPRGGGDKVKKYSKVMGLGCEHIWWEFYGNSFPFLTLAPGPLLRTHAELHWVHLYSTDWASRTLCPSHFIKNSFSKAWIPWHVCFKQCGNMRFSSFYEKEQRIWSTKDFWRLQGLWPVRATWIMARAGKDTIDQHSLFEFSWHKTVRE